MSSITKEGIYIKQGKTGKAQIKLFNDDLRRVIAAAKKS